MYCRSCGESMEVNTTVCARCGAAVGEGTDYCPNCGNSTQAGAEACLYCGCVLKAEEKRGKSKVLAGLLGIFLGGLGIHNFYLGFTGRGIAQLMITLVSLATLSWISAIWGIVEGIQYLSGSRNRDADGNPLR